MVNDAPGETPARRRRSSSRLPIAVPVTIGGTDANGNYWAEQTLTQKISRNGCCVLLYTRVEVGSIAEIVGAQHRRPVKARVVYVGETDDAEVSEIGLQFLEPVDFWGISFPQDLPSSSRALPAPAGERVEAGAAIDRGDWEEARPPGGRLGTAQPVAGGFPQAPRSPDLHSALWPPEPSGRAPGNEPAPASPKEFDLQTGNRGAPSAAAEERPARPQGKIGEQAGTLVSDIIGRWFQQETTALRERLNQALQSQAEVQRRILTHQLQEHAERIQSMSQAELLHKVEALINDRLSAGEVKLREVVRQTEASVAALEAQMRSTLAGVEERINQAIDRGRAGMEHSLLDAQEKIRDNFSRAVLAELQDKKSALIEQMTAELHMASRGSFRELLGTLNQVLELAMDSIGAGASPPVSSRGASADPS